MCGVLLIYSKKKKLNKDICNETLRELSNRGPDRTLSNFFLDNHLFIGNTILNIVGPIKNSKNLYKSESNRYHVSFNGEIYDYKKIYKNKKFLFSSVNDTDFLANIHDFKNELEITKLLDGMFAYCVFDEKNNNIFFASDVQGEKKLFYYNDDNYLICSSNILAIKKFLIKKKLQIEINISRFKDYFDTRHFIFSNETIYNKINYFDPGTLHSYSIRKDKITKKKFDNPINWINEKKYLRFNKDEKFTIKYFENLFQNNLKKMIPDIPFTSAMSGGIDSSLQLKIISNIDNKNIHSALFIDNGIKDPFSKRIKKFNDFLDLRIEKVKCNSKKYFSNVAKCYKSLHCAFFSHDLPGRNIVYNYCKRNKFKVVFIGEGADEIFGGYKFYQNIDWNNKMKKNPSPYSNFNNNFSKEKQKIKIKSDKLWLRAFKKYNKFLDFKESKMQATLFTDYFIQAIGNTNIATDLISGENSVETRNVFITKDVIKNAINLPMKYKINLKNKNSFILKPLLKTLFSKYYSKNLIFKKQGFSGFPNESINFLQVKDKKKLNLLISKFKLKHELNRASEWKLINCFYFKKFCKMKLSLEKIF
ncbi:asparagine synthase-related protein [Candidatus Pelagibacter sp.]|nr:asparagine synthase-related protein [Candidatus Pelagibacter sp.]